MKKRALVLTIGAICSLSAAACGDDESAPDPLVEPDAGGSKPYGPTAGSSGAGQGGATAGQGGFSGYGGTAGTDVPAQGGAGAASQGGTSGGGPTAPQGTFTLSPQSTYIQMRQLEQHLVFIDVSRSQGFNAPISITLGGVPMQVEAELGEAGVVQDGVAHVALNFRTARIAQQGATTVRIHGQANGAPDVETSLTLNVSTRRVYRGGFTMGTYTIYSVSPSGDRCEWNVSWQAEVEFTVATLEDNGAGTARVWGTRTSTPVQATVGTTTCNPSNRSQSGSASFVSTYPVAGASVPVVVGVGTEIVDIGGPYSEQAGAIEAKAKIRYVRDGGGGESLETLAPLFLQTP